MDGDVLYLMVRHLKPRRMIEIGSGYSTLAAGAALVKNAEETGVVCDFTAIEPYPGKHISSGVPGLTTLLPKPVQAINLDTFASLEENDILFIDSTHVVMIDSDVVYEVLEILPRLRPGVVVHFHDIFLPYDYPENWIRSWGFFWNEAYMLQAFLAHNDRFEVMIGNRALFVDRHTIVPRCFRAAARIKLLAAVQRCCALDAHSLRVRAIWLYAQPPAQHPPSTTSASCSNNSETPLPPGSSP